MVVLPFLVCSGAHGFPGGASTGETMDYLIGNRALCQSLLLDDGSLHAVGLGDLHHGAVGVAGLEELVQLLGKIGALAEADAVFLGVCLLYTSPSPRDA